MSLKIFVKGDDGTNLIMSLIGILRRRPSNVGTSTLHPVKAFPRRTLAVKTRSFPSRLKRGWGLSLTIKTISAGTLLGPWSPSLGNVMRVPSRQPFLTVMVRILSRMLEVWPSSFITWRCKGSVCKYWKNLLMRVGEPFITVQEVCFQVKVFLGQQIVLALKIICNFIRLLVFKEQVHSKMVFYNTHYS